MGFAEVRSAAGAAILACGVRNMIASNAAPSSWAVICQSNFFAVIDINQAHFTWATLHVFLYHHNI